MKIRGRLKGEIGDQKLFRAEFGVFDMKIYEFVSFSSFERSVKIISSTLDVFRKVNGDYNYIASPGETLNYIIEFKNTGEDIYRNLTLEFEIDSNIIDFSSIQVIGGTVERGKITFSYNDFPDLLFLGPYGEGELGFKMNVKEYSSKFHPNNGLIKEGINFGGIRKSFQTKVTSETTFSQEVYYNEGEFPTLIKDTFQNSGSFPLQSGQETKLVVVFNINNFGNSLKNVEISTRLGQNIEYLEKNIYPSGVKFTFNKSTRSLVLNVGSLSAYLPSKIFAFQLKIKPQALPATLVGKTEVKGQDTWTGQSFVVTVPVLKTDLIQ
ncbi:MAG: hypothetical protein O2U61_04715, partial [Candidatus Bathyarchaeota archaeon]|nr:hypothetical protein [Candidatus Bathyarchaeota archaeon]